MTDIPTPPSWAEVPRTTVRWSLARVDGDTTDVAVGDRVTLQPTVGGIAVVDPLDLSPVSIILEPRTYKVRGDGALVDDQGDMAAVLAVDDPRVATPGGRVVQWIARHERRNEVIRFPAAAGETVELSRWVAATAPESVQRSWAEQLVDAAEDVTAGLAAAVGAGDAAVAAAGQAAGSAGSAAGSASAAAQSATAAAASAQGAETARAGASALATDAGNHRIAAIAAKNEAITARDGAVTAAGEAASARGEAVDAQGGAEAARDQAVTARTGAETALTDANTARDTASAAATTATGAATTATEQAGLATTARAGAEAARDQAVVAAASSVTTALWLPGASGNTVACPSTPALESMQGIDLRARLAPTAWSGEAERIILSKYIFSSRGWWFFLGVTGLLRLTWETPDGQRTLQSASPVPFANGAWGWVRATLDPAAGVATFYTSADGATWTQLGPTVTTTPAAHVIGTAAVEVGTYNGGGALRATRGLVQRASIRDLSGTVVASWDGRAPATRHRDPQGNIWTVSGTANAWQVVS